MQKLWFAALLTAAVAFAQATGGSEGKSGAGTKKVDTKSRKSAPAKSGTAVPQKGAKNSTGGHVDVVGFCFGASQPPQNPTGPGATGPGKARPTSDLNVGKKVSKVSKRPLAKRPEPPAK
jgi:hypothetical protein